MLVRYKIGDNFHITVDSSVGRWNNMHNKLGGRPVVQTTAQTLFPFTFATVYSLSSSSRHLGFQKKSGDWTRVQNEPRRERGGGLGS